VSKDVVFPGIVRIKEMIRVHFIGVDKLIVNKWQSSFEKCVVFIRPVTIERMGDNIAIVEFTEDKTTN
jgi:hypothetical protein